MSKSDAYLEKRNELLVEINGYPEISEKTEKMIQSYDAGFDEATREKDAQLREVENRYEAIIDAQFNRIKSLESKLAKAVGVLDKYESESEWFIPKGKDEQGIEMFEGKSVNLMRTLAREVLTQIRSDDGGEENRLHVELKIDPSIPDDVFALEDHTGKRHFFNMPKVSE